MSLIVLSVLLFASNANIPPNVPVYGYKETPLNIFVSRISRNSIENNITFTPSQPAEAAPNSFTFNYATIDLALQLKQIGVDAGYINIQTLKDLGKQLPVSERIETISKDRYDAELKIIGTPLQDIKPAPLTAINRNFIQIPNYNVNAPIVYAGFEDMFGKNDDGTINFSSVQDTSDVNSPLQKLLQDGVVHLPFTPYPGDIGNSYIVGHSSNFAFIRSDYNQVFKPIEKKGNIGETFTIFDPYGRDLQFKIFETQLIEEDQTSDAYKLYEGKRVVTLQTSVVSYRPSKGLYPYQRWLVRGELVCENNETCS